MNTHTCNLNKISVEKFLNSIEVDKGDIINFINPNNAYAIIVDKSYFLTNEPNFLPNEEILDYDFTSDISNLNFNYLGFHNFEDGIDSVDDNCKLIYGSASFSRNNITNNLRPNQLMLIIVE